MGEAGQCVPAERDGFNGDAREVDGDTPEVTALREARIYRCKISIRVEYVVGHGMEVVDEGQVDLRVSEVRRNVRDHRAGVGTDEVVLLRVTVKQRRLWFWTADRRQSLHE